MCEVKLLYTLIDINYGTDSYYDPMLLTPAIPDTHTPTAPHCCVLLLYCFVLLMLSAFI